MKVESVLVGFLFCLIPVPAIAEVGAHWHTNTVTAHCVDNRELSGVHLNPAISRDQLERRWDLTAADRINLTRHTGNIGGHQAYAYPWCGWPLSKRLVTVTVERSNRPGYTPKPAGDRTVVSVAGWVL